MVKIASTARARRRLHAIPVAFGLTALMLAMVISIATTA